MRVPAVIGPACSMPFASAGRGACVDVLALSCSWFLAGALASHGKTYHYLNHIAVCAAGRGAMIKNVVRTTECPRAVAFRLAYRLLPPNGCGRASVRRMFISRNSNGGQHACTSTCNMAHHTRSGLRNDGCLRRRGRHGHSTHGFHDRSPNANTGGVAPGTDSPGGSSMTPGHPL